MTIRTLGFVGLGVMGEPICRNLLHKSKRPLTVFDLAPEPLARMRECGASIAASVGEAAASSDVIFLCLPSATHVQRACDDGLLSQSRVGTIVVDLGTTSVPVTRELARTFARAMCHWVDHPSPGPGRRRRTAR